jgi:translation initiation factor IF-3
MPTFEAMRLASERGVDLVEVAPTAIPPVCRLMDYGRFKYEQTKKEREARKNQKVVELKEVRLTPRTDEHDVMAKVKTIQKFLGEGDKVKVTIRFRGRELAHPQLGREVLEEISKELSGTAVIERPPLMEGRAMFMILSPPGLRSGPPQGARPPQGVPVPPGPGPGGPRPPMPPGGQPRPPMPQGGPIPAGAPRPAPVAAPAGPPQPGPAPRPPLGPGGPAAGPRPAPGVPPTGPAQPMPRPPVGPGNGPTTPPPRPRTP